MEDKKISTEEAEEILQCLLGHASPTLHGRDKSQIYKIQKSITLSRIVYKSLFTKIESPNKFLDYLLAQLFNLSYDDCYGRKAAKHNGKNIMWDFQEIFKKFDDNISIIIKEV